MKTFGGGIGRSNSEPFRSGNGTDNGEVSASVFFEVRESGIYHSDKACYIGVCCVQFYFPVQVHILETDAGLTINENADPDVRHDFQTFFNKLVPDGAPYFIHTLEGPDDMSAHIKASLIGSSVTIPIKNHRLNLGTWQGVYLCEFRDGGDTRKLSITIL